MRSDCKAFEYYLGLVIIRVNLYNMFTVNNLAHFNVFDWYTKPVETVSAGFVYQSNTLECAFVCLLEVTNFSFSVYIA